MDEAVQELKETEFRDVFKKDLVDLEAIFTTDCVIETDFELLIPDQYISNISERLRVYNDLDNLQEEEELNQFVLDRLEDRFGKIPDVVEDLIKVVRV